MRPPGTCSFGPPVAPARRCAGAGQTCSYRFAGPEEPPPRKPGSPAGARGTPAGCGGRSCGHEQGGAGFSGPASNGALRTRAAITLPRPAHLLGHQDGQTGSPGRSCREQPRASPSGQPVPESGSTVRIPAARGRTLQESALAGSRGQGGAGIEGILPSFEGGTPSIPGYSPPRQGPTWRDTNAEWRLLNVPAARGLQAESPVGLRSARWFVSVT